MTDVASPARSFLAQMLGRHQLQAEPIVALLGPHGAGKSTALAAISQQCGGTVIHASIDFDAHDLDPIQAAAFISFEMMRSWDISRRDPAFHRFALGLLARNEPLPPSRPLAQRQIRDLIRQYVRDTPQGRTASQVATVADASLDVAVKSLGHLAGGLPLSPAVLSEIRKDAKPVIGSLLQSAARLTIRSALDYYHVIPEAESAQADDSLIQLSRADPALAIKILLEALLADMAWHAIHHPQMQTRCACITPDGQPDGRHAHAWVLLVDGAETAAGGDFLTALAEARSERIRAGDFDPLLVIASYAQWDTRWHARWCEPWSTLPRPGLDQQRIPFFSQATYHQWAKGSTAALADGDVTAAWFPVWLDPLSPERAARLITPSATSLSVPQLAHRLTGGHPGALMALQDQIAAVNSGAAAKATLPGALLVTETPARAPLWWSWAKASLPAGLLSPAGPQKAIPRTTAAAAYLADRRVAEDEGIPGDVPDLQDILDLLRQHLWITTFGAVPSRIGPVTGAATDHLAALHPWLARCLLAAAATTPRIRNLEGKPVPGQPPHPAWDDLFAPLASAFAAPQDGMTAQPADADRALYYELALWEKPPRHNAQPTSGFPAVVAALAGSFNTEDHRIWVNRLDYITSAPCRLPLKLSTEEAYTELMTGQDGRAVIEVATAKLVALLWLYRDPLTEHTSRWDHEIHDSFDRLRSSSRRADTSALKEAAACFPLLPVRAGTPVYR